MGYRLRACDRLRTRKRSCACFFVGDLMRNGCAGLAGATLLFLAAGAASASTFDFYFGGHGGLNDSYSFMSNGVTVDVTAGSFKNGFQKDYSPQMDDDGNVVNGYITKDNSYDPNALVGQYSHGLGVTNNTWSCHIWTCSTDNKHTVDGSYWDDFLVFSFSHHVQLTSADFRYFNTSHDDFRLFYDWNGDGELGDDDFITYKYEDDPFYDFPIISTDLIGFVATDHNDSWKLKSIHGHVAPIPLPATAFMLLAGLGGLALMRRRES